MIHPAKLLSCVYCGGPRECLDHVLPHKHRHHPEANQNCRFLVACCNRCNGIAGDKLFGCFAEKFDYLEEFAKQEGRWNEANIATTHPLMCAFTFLIDVHGLLDIERRYNGLARYSYGRTKTDGKRRDKNALREAEECLKRVKNKSSTQG